MQPVNADAGVLPTPEKSLGLEFVHARFTYEPDTGSFFWNAGAGNHIVAGRLAGHKDVHGYVSIRIQSIRVKAHRLAWFYVHGEWPKFQIDHINGVRHDNRIANLRDVPARVNCQNLRAAKSDNQSGLLGVTRSSKNRFLALIGIDGKQFRLGTFGSPEAAHEAYLAAKRILHPGCQL